MTLASLRHTPDARRGHALLGRSFALALLLATFLLGGGALEADARDKLVILGFDGADAELTQQWMDEGRLPNLARLREHGDYRPLMPTNPPQTPVSWATFATGLDPGHTEIFDFLKRIPGSYYPDFAMMSPAKQDLLWGKNNAWLTAMLGLVAGLLVFLVILAMVRVRGLRLVLGTIIPALVLGAIGFWFGSTYLPHEIPKAINNRKGLTYWEYANDQGLNTRTVRVPGTFPVNEVDKGSMLAGLGVPDLRGRVGTPSMYTSEVFSGEEYNDFSVELFTISRRGTTETEIIGPKNLPFHQYKLEEAEDEAREAGKNPGLARQIMEDRLRKQGVTPDIRIPLSLEITDHNVTVNVQDETHTLTPGQWSPWVHLTFNYNQLVKVDGIGRFMLAELDPDVKLYFSPLHFDPAGVPPFIHITYPQNWAAELEQQFGPFKTMGWSIDTWSLEEERIDEKTFMDDVDETILNFTTMYEEFIADEDVDIFTQIFYFTDRVQHMLWRLRDKGHPRYDAEVARLFEGEIFRVYAKMDELVGRAMERMDDGTHLMVVSDHGFSTWRRAVNLNTWLVRNGYMVLTGEGRTTNLEMLFDKGSFWPNVDWSRTKAFALGLGYVYINVLGREPEGSVLPGEEYDAVCQEIRRGLESYIDDKTGLHPVTRVYHRDEIYADGYDRDLIPDLRVCNNDGYRVSWQSSLGNTPAEVLYDVEKNWSGDHCSLDPELVKGIFFSSFPIAHDPWIGDVFPTICDLLDLNTPSGLHGRSLVEPADDEEASEDEDDSAALIR